MKTVADIPLAFKDTSQLFIALGDPHRQRILLSFEHGERLNILQIVSASTLSRTAVTHHLKILHNSGALTSEKVGKEVYFWINLAFIEERLSLVLQYIKAEC